MCACLFNVYVIVSYILVGTHVHINLYTDDILFLFFSVCVEMIFTRDNSIGGDSENELRAAVPTSCEISF